ncbi:hypothetical protein [Rhodococcus sp. 077-4]|uniref:hypothetical protein n=1 Tax=Rhodococcus sp. 077-4 TaxID=2789271 RepID=UPI0039F61D7A
MHLRLILDRWRWRVVRDFLVRNRFPPALSAEERADDYVAVAEAFGLVWPGDPRRIDALLIGFGDPDPDAVRASMDPVVAPLRLRPLVRVWTRAVE